MGSQYLCTAQACGTTAKRSSRTATPARPTRSTRCRFPSLKCRDRPSGDCLGAAGRQHFQRRLLRAGTRFRFSRLTATFLEQELPFQRAAPTPPHLTSRGFPVPVPNNSSRGWGRGECKTGPTRGAPTSPSWWTVNAPARLRDVHPPLFATYSCVYYFRFFLSLLFLCVWLCASPAVSRTRSMYRPPPGGIAFARKKPKKTRRALRHRGGWTRSE